MRLRTHLGRRVWGIPAGRIIAALALGLATTYAVVVAASVAPAIQGRTYVRTTPTGADWLWPPPPAWTKPTNRVFSARSWGYLERGVRSYERYYPEGREPTPDAVGMQRMYAAGLPFHAASYKWSSDRAGSWSSGFYLSDDWSSVTLQADAPLWSSLLRERAVIPLRPIWLGMIADLCVWAVVWLGILTAGHTFLRRRVRIGHCLTCRYEIGGLAVCPECGTPVPPSPTPTQKHPA